MIKNIIFCKELECKIDKMKKEKYEVRVDGYH